MTNKDEYVTIELCDAKHKANEDGIKNIKDVVKDLKDDIRGIFGLTILNILIVLGTGIFMVGVRMSTAKAEAAYDGGNGCFGFSQEHSSLPGNKIDIADIQYTESENQDKNDLPDAGYSNPSDVDFVGGVK